MQRARWNEVYSSGNLKTECYTGQVEYEQSGGTGTPGWISHIENPGEPRLGQSSRAARVPMPPLVRGMGWFEA